MNIQVDAAIDQSPEAHISINQSNPFLNEPKILTEQAKKSNDQSKEAAMTELESLLENS